MRKLLISCFLIINIFLFSNNSISRTHSWEIESRRYINERLRRGADYWNKTITQLVFIMTSMNIDNRNLDRIKFKKQLIYDCSFKNTSLKYSDCTRASFNSCYLINTDFRYAKLDGAILSSMDKISNKAIRNSNFSNISFIHGVITRNDLVNCNFSHSNFTDSRIDTFYEIKWCNFYKVTFYRSIIDVSTKFIECNFAEADFRLAQFVFNNGERRNLDKKPLFLNCNFTNANLTGIKHLNNAAFTGSNMAGAKIERKWYSYVKKQGVRNFDKINWQ